MLDVGADQALAFRVAGHHLDRRVGADEAVAAIGLQEYPPGWGAWRRCGRARSSRCLRTRQVNAFRGSPYVVPRADVRVFTAALVPEDEAGLKALVGVGPAKEVIEEGFRGGRGAPLVAAAARDGLAAGPLDRDAFHQAMRERLPAGLLPWCRGCQSHHVRPGFWRALGPLEVTVMPGKATGRWRSRRRCRSPRRARSWCGASCASTARRRTPSSRPGRRPRLACEAALRRGVGRVRARGRRGPAGSCSPRTWTGGVAAGGVGRAAARRLRPLRGAARPRVARAGRRGEKRLFPRSGARASCWSTACWRACGAGRRRSTSSSSPSSGSASRPTSRRRRRRSPAARLPRGPAHHIADDRADRRPCGRCGCKRRTRGRCRPSSSRSTASP